MEKNEPPKGFSGLGEKRGDHKQDLVAAKKEAARSKAASGSAGHMPDATADMDSSSRQAGQQRRDPTNATATSNSMNNQPAANAAKADTSGGTAPGWVIFGSVVFVLFVVGLIANGASKSPTRQPASDYVPTAVAEPAAAESPPAPERAFVTAVMANVRQGPGTNWNSIAQVPQLQEVYILSESDGWSQVSFDAAQTGYVSSSLLTKGSYDDARAAVCEVGSTPLPYSGQVLKQTGTGTHQLTVNAGSQDVLVKLRRGPETVLAFFVNKGQSGVVKNVPDGSYSLMFASGEQFSTKCLEFLSAMEVTADPNPVVFEVSTTSDGYNTYRSSVAAEYTLTQVSQGNFRPQSLGADDFKE